MTQKTLPPPRQPGPQRLVSLDLFGKGREVVILHQGEEYRLRITGSGKLLLTK